jgi:predicted dehydrogenase
MLNIGIIGCGMVAHGHLAAVAQSKDWHLAAIAEVDPARRQAAETHYHPDHSFEDYRTMLASTKLDAVVVATHADTHYEITVDALARNIHVLCEKPMADSMEKCRKMIEAADQNKRLLAVNFNTRSSQEYLQIKGLIDTGEIGKIRVVRFVYDWSAHQWQPPERLENFMKNGGPIIDSAVHFFEGVRWFTGQEFKRIDACGVTLPPYDAPQHAIATCQMVDGAIALVEAGWLFTKRTKDRGDLFNITVIGDDGSIDYNTCDYYIRFWSKTRTEKILCTDQEKHFEFVLGNFAESIRQNKLIVLASGYDGYKATEAAYQALASAKI